jgi:hypothetical protein
MSHLVLLSGVFLCELLYKLRVPLTLNADMKNLIE